MGGMTIIRWAIRQPDTARALVISGMGIFTEPRRGLAHEALRRALPGQARVVAGRCFEQYKHVPARMSPVVIATAAAVLVQR